MSHPRRAPSFKIQPTAAGWMTIVAAYALDFSWVVSGYWGLSLLAYWLGFVITLAVIVMYVPRGWDVLLIVALSVASLAAILAS